LSSSAAASRRTRCSGGSSLTSASASNGTKRRVGPGAPAAAGRRLAPPDYTLPLPPAAESSPHVVLSH
jgi:hypothetical protein